MSFSLKYNDIWLGSATYGVLVVAAPRNAMSDVRLDFQPYVSRDGGASQGATLKPKFWTDQIHVVGNSWSDARARLDSVRFVLSSTGGVKVLRYDEDMRLEAAYQREYLARLNGPLLGNWIAPTRFQTQLNWIVPSGRARALSDTTVTPAIASSPDTFTIPTDGVSLVGGTATTRPVFTFRNTSGSSTNGVILTNTTLGQTLDWDGILEDNWYIQIDSQRERITRSLTGAFAGEESNAMSGRNPGDPFPQLAPRVNNAFSFTGLSTGTSSIVYREEFL